MRNGAPHLASPGEPTDRGVAGLQSFAVISLPFVLRLDVAWAAGKHWNWLTVSPGAALCSELGGWRRPLSLAARTGETAPLRSPADRCRVSASIRTRAPLPRPNTSSTPLRCLRPRPFLEDPSIQPLPCSTFQNWMSRIVTGLVRSSQSLRLATARQLGTISSCNDLLRRAFDLSAATVSVYLYCRAQCACIVATACA